MKHQKHRLGETEVLLLNEEITAWKVIKGKEPEVMPNIASNQDEADIHVAFATGFDNYLIRSTDSDVLFINLINEPVLRSKNIVIPYNVASSSPKYVTWQRTCSSD